MAVPRFSGYGYQAGAQFQRHALSLGQFAGMSMPELAHGATGGFVDSPIRQPGGVRGVHGAGSEGPRVAAGALRAGGFHGLVPQLRSYGAPSQRPLGPVNALRFQGQPAGFGVRSPTPVSAQTRAASAQARSQLWQQARDRVSAWNETPEAAPTPAGYTALSSKPPLPGTQLALPKPSIEMGPSGWTTGGKLFEMPETPGAPIPSTRAPRRRRDAFAPNQGALDL